MASDKVFHFGNSAFAKNGDVITNKEGCLRIVLLRAHGVESKISPQTKKTFALGHANEKVFVENYIVNNPDIESFIEEKEYLQLFDNGTSKVGHSDVVAIGTNGTPIIFELKAVSSVSKHKDYVLNGEYKLDNLAQCVNYMLHFKAPVGYLVYSSYIYGDYYSSQKNMPSIKAAYENKQIISSDSFKFTDKGVKITPSDRFHKVEISQNGAIYVNGLLTDYNAKDVLSHTNLALKHLDDDVIADKRPISTDWPPCNLCPYSSICSIHEQTPLSTKEFVDLAKAKVGDLTDE
jgi:hypothetical protein